MKYVHMYEGASPRVISMRRQPNNYFINFLLHAHVSFLYFYSRNSEKPPSPSPERTSTMVSRRRILSRSRDDLNIPDNPLEEEDVWFSKDKLLKVSERIFTYLFPFIAFGNATAAIKCLLILNN